MTKLLLSLKWKKILVFRIFFFINLIQVYHRSLMMFLSVPRNNKGEKMFLVLNEGIET